MVVKITSFWMLPTTLPKDYLHCKSSIWLLKGLAMHRLMGLFGIWPKIRKICLDCWTATAYRGNPRASRSFSWIFPKQNGCYGGGTGKSDKLKIRQNLLSDQALFVIQLWFSPETQTILASKEESSSQQDPWIGSKRKWFAKQLEYLRSHRVDTLCNSYIDGENNPQSSTPYLATDFSCNNTATEQYASTRRASVISFRRG